jgi:hypothetical protein
MDTQQNKTVLEMQPLVVDLDVLHAADGVDAALLERDAVDPARRLAQARAQLALLALQQVDVPG